MVNSDQILSQDSWNFLGTTFHVCLRGGNATELSWLATTAPSAAGWLTLQQRFSACPETLEPPRRFGLGPAKRDEGGEGEAEEGNSEEQAGMGYDASFWLLMGKIEGKKR